MSDLKNFVECETFEDANEVSLLEYRFIGLRRNKDGLQVYSFQRRAKRLGL